METESSHLPLDLVVLSLSLFVHTSRKQRQPATAFPAPRLSTLYVSVSVSVHVSVLTLNCFWLARRSAPGVWGNLRFELQRFTLYNYGYPYRRVDRAGGYADAHKK